MAVTDRACEWFVWDLRRSNLLERGQIDQVVSEFLTKNPSSEPPALAQYLVGQGLLSQFQADRLLQGKTQGLVLNAYTLTDALGSGSMGTVYKARCKTDNRWYAVKVLPRRSMWNVRIARRQVRAFERCQHPAVVPFADVGTSGGMHYLAWPLAEGETLERLIERTGKLAPAMAARYALQTAEGLDVCHQNGLIHGLLKPSNLMVGPDQQVRILDFGIGTLLVESEGESLVDTMSTANSLTSGLDCASPESILEPHNRTPAGDQYSLGCVLYFCLTGRYPFADEASVQKMMAHQSKEPAPIRQFSPEVPDAMLAIVERLMQKQPHNRFASITEVMQALIPQAAALPQVVRASRSNNGRAPEPVKSRKSAQGTAPAVAPVQAVVVGRDIVHKLMPANPPAPVAVSPQPSAAPAPIAWEEKASPTLEDRIGMLGMVVTALLVGILMWVVWIGWHR